MSYGNRAVYSFWTFRVVFSTLPRKTCRNETHFVNAAFMYWNLLFPLLTSLSLSLFLLGSFEFKLRQENFIMQIVGPFVWPQRLSIALMLKVFSVYCKIKPLCLVGKERGSLEAFANGCVKICGSDLHTKAFCAGSPWLYKGGKPSWEGKAAEKQSWNSCAHYFKTKLLLYLENKVTHQTSTQTFHMIIWREA